VVRQDPAANTSVSKGATITLFISPNGSQVPDVVNQQVAIAEDLGFDGALGTICEVRYGRYTGRALRALHAEAKAECLREVAKREGLDLAECTAYSDSHTDVPFLEAVGHPVAVNPDRALRRIAAERSWPVLEFRMRHAA